MPKSKNKRFLKPQMANAVISKAAAHAAEVNPRASFPAVFYAFMDAPELLSTKASPSHIDIYYTLNLQNLQLGVKEYKLKDREENLAFNKQLEKVYDAAVTLYDNLKDYNDWKDNPTDIVNPILRNIDNSIKAILSIGKTQAEITEIKATELNPDWLKQVLAIYDKFHEIRNHFELPALETQFEKIDDKVMTSAERAERERQADAEMNARDDALFGFSRATPKNLENKTSNQRTPTSAQKPSQGGVNNSKPSSLAATEAKQATQEAKAAALRKHFDKFQSTLQGKEAEAARKTAEAEQLKAQQKEEAANTTAQVKKSSASVVPVSQATLNSIPLKPVAGGPQPPNRDAINVQGKPDATTPEGKLNNFTATSANQSAPNNARPTERLFTSKTKLPPVASATAKPGEESKQGNQITDKINELQKDIPNREDAAVREQKAKVLSELQKVAAQREANLAADKAKSDATNVPNQTFQELDAVVTARKDRLAAEANEAKSGTTNVPNQTSQELDAMVTARKDRLAAEANEAKSGATNVPNQTSQELDAMVTARKDRLAAEANEAKSGATNVPNQTFQELDAMVTARKARLAAEAEAAAAARAQQSGNNASESKESKLNNRTSNRIADLTNQLHNEAKSSDAAAQARRDALTAELAQVVAARKARIDAEARRQPTGSADESKDNNNRPPTPTQPIRLPGADVNPDPIPLPGADVIPDAPPLTVEKEPEDYEDLGLNELFADAKTSPVPVPNVPSFSSIQPGTQQQGLSQQQSSTQTQTTPQQTPVAPRSLLTNWDKDLADDVIKMARAANNSTALHRMQSMMEHVRLKALEFNSAGFENLTERKQLKAQWDASSASLEQLTNKIAENTARLIVSQDNLPNCINYLKTQDWSRMKTREANNLLTETEENLDIYEKMWSELESIKQSVNATSQDDYTNRIRLSATKIVKFPVDLSDPKASKPEFDKQFALLCKEMNIDAQASNGIAGLSTRNRVDAKVDIKNEMAIMAIKGWDSNEVNIAKDNQPLTVTLNLDTIYSLGPLNNRGELALNIYQSREDSSTPHVMAKFIINNNLMAAFPEIKDPNNIAEAKQTLIELFKQLPPAPPLNYIKMLLNRPLPDGTPQLDSSTVKAMHKDMIRTVRDPENSAFSNQEDMLTAKDMVEKMRDASGGETIIIEPTCPPELKLAVIYYCEAKMRETKDPKVKAQYDYFDPLDVKGTLRREALKHFTLNPLKIYEKIQDYRKVSAAVNTLKDSDQLKTPKLTDVSFRDQTKIDNIYVKSDRDNRKVNQLHRSLDVIGSKMQRINNPDIQVEIDKQVAAGPRTRRK